MDGWRWSCQSPQRFWMKRAGRNAKRPHFLGCGLLENVAELVNQRCRRTRRNPSSSLERRRKAARRLVRFGIMVQAHTAERQVVSSGVVVTSLDPIVPELGGDVGVDGPGGGDIAVGTALVALLPLRQA